MFNKPLWSLTLGETTINVMIINILPIRIVLSLGEKTISVMIVNILPIRIVSKNFYLDISIEGNIQFSFKTPR